MNPEDCAEDLYARIANHAVSVIPPAAPTRKEHLDDR